MKVKLIQVTQNPIDVMWTAARTCYSEKSPIQMWDYDRYNQTQEEIDECFELKEEWIRERQEKMWNLVKKVLDSGHQSVAEHVYFTFAIEGVSRSLLAQITRHRAGIVFSQQSQRYVEIKENINEVQNFRAFPVSKREDAIKMCNKYFVNVNESNCSGYIESLWEYLNAINDGLKPEDARNFLPNATKTNITMSINYRELIHICNLRLCTRAQKEIRDLFKLIVEEVKKQDERLASYLVPTCEINGFCKENKCCGSKPKLEDVLEGFHKYEGLNK